MTGRGRATVTGIIVVALVMVVGVAVVWRSALVAGGDASGVPSAGPGAAAATAGGSSDAAQSGAASRVYASASSGPGGAAASAVPQTWSGTLRILTPVESVGTLEATFVRQGDSLSGSLTTDASPCFSNGGIQGVIDGASVEFSLLQRDEVDFEGDVTGDTMSGTVSVACDDSQGSWTLTLQP